MLSQRVSVRRQLLGTRNLITSARRHAFAPPDPASLGQPTKVKYYPRTRKWMRRLLVFGAISGGVYVVDNRFYASCLTRTARTFTTALIVGLDYKINFRDNPPFANSIVDIHNRSAERLFDMLMANGGLYVKVGQAIAHNASFVLPSQFRAKFQSFYEDASQNTWSQVKKVIYEEFGKSPEEVFGVSFTGDSRLGTMERSARASASVAQVHWARLADGREVAIKIQKSEIAPQVTWDLWAFKVISKAYSWWFDLPFDTFVPFISERLMLECDFEQEANNSEKMEKLVAGERRLRNRVYIPKVYRELSSKRVMTTEWIEGVRMWEKEAISAPWYGGWRQGSPGCDGQSLDKPGTPLVQPHHGKGGQLLLKPERQHWRGRSGKGGLGLSIKDVMTTMVDLFSAQIFLWGTVHCDPHPGNIFVRRKPNGKSELVLIDHGLYITMREDFRLQYAEFWKALMTFDNKRIHDIMAGWGIGSPDLFASVTLLRPYSGGDKSTSDTIKKGMMPEHSFEAQDKMRQSIRQMLGSSDKWPQELIFIGRNLRIVQGNNQYLGSPVNRVKITGNWASRALVEAPNLSLVERFKWYSSHLLFKMALLSSDVVFYFSKIRQMLGLGGGMEDDIEAQMKRVAKEAGVDMSQNMFEG